MSINATFIGQFIAFIFIPLFAITMALLGYYLGKRKTETPKLVAAIGFFSAIIPPLALIFMMILVLKKDIEQVDRTV